MAKRELQQSGSAQGETAIIQFEAPDETLVDETVHFIQATLARTLHRGMAEIGEFVFAKFFNGDAEFMRSHAPNKSASFRALLSRCESLELPLRQSALHDAVSVAAMQTQIRGGAVSFKQLPPSHQAALLPLRVPAQIEKMAARAISKKLSVREVRTLVVEERTKANGGERFGRRPTPLVVKSLSHALALIVFEGGRRSFLKAEIDALDGDQAQRALKDAKQLLGGLQKLIPKLEAKCGA